MRYYEFALHEAVYDGNLGMEEMFKFYQYTKKTNQPDLWALMQKLVKNGDVKGMRLLIKKVLGVELMP